ncbi:MAG: glutathione S-transferase family protein [Hyphomonadaceae bacterium]|nr:glutathione S-transferase family protein [Hyphomonadaceae bacterium]
MILIGQYDSPFVRRVAIALRLYGVPFEHKPWSVFGDAEKIAQYNPLMRVPTLVMDSGEVVIESAAILDALDQTAGAAKAMMPLSGDLRREAQKVCALATGLADKAVSLGYERHVHKRETESWVERCLSQIAGALGQLEASRTRNSKTEWWFGSSIGHADITVACALRFLGDAHAGLFDLSEGWPMLAAHAAKCEALPPFREITQPFSVTPPKS